MKYLFHVLMMACVVVMMGCGPSKPRDLPPLHSVQLTVLQEGTPLEDATVSLLTTGTKLANYGVSGKTNASGVVNLETKSNVGQWEGVPEGKYILLISKKSIPPLDTSVNENPTSPEERAKLEKAQAKQMDDTKETVALDFSQFSQAKHELSIPQGGLKETIDTGKAVSIPLSKIVPSSH